MNAGRSKRRHIVINHLENIKGICTKTGLLRSLRKFYKQAAPVSCGYSVYDSTPTSFIVLADCGDAEYQGFLQRYHEIARGNFRNERLPSKHCANNVWLVKPAAENQGRGIAIFKNDLQGMKRFLASKAPNIPWVIQKYIERPLLYCGRKFDIRMWAVITWKRELYYYRHGYVRTSSDTYSLDNNLSSVHLTNNCLQKYKDKYGCFEEGNTLSLEVLEKYMAEQYPGFNLDKHVFPRVRDLMIDTFLSVKNELNPGERRNCFELLGFDFMIDEDLRTWLIEVNTNPYLGVPNKFIEGLLPKMLNDLFAITLDPYVKNPNKLPASGNCAD